MIERETTMNAFIKLIELTLFLTVFGVIGFFAFFVL
jgi:hypothetical protein